MGFFSRNNRIAVQLPQPVQAVAPELQNAQIASVYSGQRMGGDFYDFLRVSPDRVVFGLLDAAGHLEGTREILMAAQQTFRRLSAELLTGEDINESEAMIELCIQLNRTILQAAEGVHACPAFAGCYNETLGTICYFNAGHTPGLLRDGAGVLELPATTLPLGLFSHATCDAPTVALTPGAVLLLVSRGALEGKCKGEEFGLEGVIEVLEACKSTNAKQLCSNILDGLQQFMCVPPTHDDVTALALVRQATKAEAAGA
jgi:serine phosphatase RsbU (regulator of sigma subunit)